MSNTKNWAEIDAALSHETNSQQSPQYTPSTVIAHTPQPVSGPTVVYSNETSARTHDYLELKAKAKRRKFELKKLRAENTELQAENTELREEVKHLKRKLKKAKKKLVVGKTNATPKNYGGKSLFSTITSGIDLATEVIRAKNIQSESKFKK